MMKQKKSSFAKKLKEYRKESLNNRTKAEVWANDRLLKSFNKCEFQLEFIHGNRRFDFFFPRVQIALEIDGGYHNSPEQSLKDMKSDMLMKERGIIVLRCKNFDEITLNKHVMLIDEKIKQKIAKKKAIMIERAKKIPNKPTKLERRQIRKQARALKKQAIGNKKKSAITKLINERQLPPSKKPVFIRRRPAAAGIHESLIFKNDADRIKFMKEQLERALKK